MVAVESVQLKHVVGRGRGRRTRLHFYRGARGMQRTVRRLRGQAILSIDRFAVWSFRGEVGREGAEGRACNLCRWHVQKLADNGAVANPEKLSGQRR